MTTLHHIDPQYREFVTGYLSAAMFTEDPEPGSGEYEPRWDTLPAETIARAYVECQRFYDDLTDDLRHVVDDDLARAGRDFWYTRNGHGCGFWDGGYEDSIGTLLTAHAHAYGEVWAEMSDGRLFFL